MSSRSSTGSPDAMDSGARTQPRLEGARVVIMGLGAHGGGAASARYCAEAGAHVTVTDLRDEEHLQESLESLRGLPVRYVLGRHEETDFRTADLVVKNPAVPRTAPLLHLARRIETDISLFLARFRGPVLAVTGTKGKSTTASALHHILQDAYPEARLGGNITVSPLTFAHEITDTTPVVLELSSFQLGDLLLTPLAAGGRLPTFSVSIITNLLPDHQDYYDSMETYARDKALIYSGQGPEQWCILANDDPWSRAYAPPHPERVVRVSRGSGHAAGQTSPSPGAGATESSTGSDAGSPAETDTLVGGATAFLREQTGVLRLPDGAEEDLVPAGTRVSGDHMRLNMLFAGTAARLFGMHAERIRHRLESFGGVPHRLEEVAVIGGVRYVNDSAATIAEASAAAVESFQSAVHLIAGGSDKGVPLEPFTGIGRSVGSIHLLSGSATDRIIPLLQNAGIEYCGPFESLDGAIDSAAARARPQEVVLLSPGCASFGMFRNEFDRGREFRRLVQERADMIE